MRPSQVRFATVNGALAMVHTLAHACCLKLDLTQATKDGTLTIHERLFGEPCRCMCESEIELPISQAPPPARVTVETEWPPGKSRVVFEGPPAPR